MERSTALGKVSAIRESLESLNEGGYHVLASAYIQGFAPDDAGKTYRQIYIELDNESLRIIRDSQTGESAPALS